MATITQNAVLNGFESVGHKAALVVVAAAPVAVIAPDIVPAICITIVAHLSCA
jgi:hypothetical protein